MKPPFRQLPPPYTVVGYHCDWNPENAPEMKRLRDNDNFLKKNGEPFEVYGYSLTTSERTELFVILKAGMGWKERYYPQGDGTQQSTWVVKGDETRGSGVDWRLEKVAPGTLVSIYFSPNARILEWKTGPLEHDFQLSPPKLSFWGATRFSIRDENDEESIARILTMAVDRQCMFFFSIFISLPFVIMTFLTLWVVYVANQQTEVRFYRHGMSTEWVNVALLFSVVYIPQLYETVASLKSVRDVWVVSPKTKNNSSLSISLRCAATIEFLNTVQPIFALCLSLYVALFISDNVFINVVLNMLALEFIADVDKRLVKIYLKNRLGEGAAISFVLLDVTYSGFQGSEFWKQNNSSKQEVLESLRDSDDLSNEWRWNLLASSSLGLGLVGKQEKKDEKTGKTKLVDWVHSFDVQLDLVDWNRTDEEALIANGRLFLATTTVQTWERIITKNQKRILFRSFPAEIERFVWSGVLQFSDLELVAEKHASHIANIMLNNSAKLTEVDLKNNPKLGDETLQIIQQNVGDKSQLRDFVYSNCGVTDIGALHIAAWLRQDKSIQYFFMAENKGITDKGARELASALTKEENRNTTLQKLFLVDCTGVSPECQEECNKLTNNRMKFDSFWN